MRHWPARKRRRARIEVIPMIDVMMFLLVFFVLISINVLPALGLKVALPTSSDPDKIRELRRVTLTITRSGDLMLDQAPTTLADLPPRLTAMDSPEHPLAVIINGDEGSDLQQLVSVLDALKAANVEAASIVAKGR